MRHSNGFLVLGTILVGLTACSDSTGPNAGRFFNTARVVVGDQHTCFLSPSGIARCWGWGALGQLSYTEASATTSAQWGGGVDAINELLSIL